VQEVSDGSSVRMMMQKTNDSALNTSLTADITHRTSKHPVFYLFCETANVLAPGVQTVLLHMDEKWFFAIVVRKHNKSVPYLGVLPVHHAAHHKSHIDKLMVIATTAFLPFANDVTKGGTARRVSCV
jgi:hypothetical protein